MTSSVSRKLILLASCIIALLILSWCLHKTVPMIVTYQTIDGSLHYTLDKWTAATYRWAALGFASALMLMFCIGVLVKLISRKETSNRGSPIR